MQFIKSLFCWHGYDNRQRFFFISISCLLTFIILNKSLSDYKFSAIVILLLCSLTYLAATRRRFNDAQLYNKWLMASVGSFLVTGLIIIFNDYASSYWLLLIPLLMTLVLLTYPSKSQKRYILGYNGPVNLSDFQQVKEANTHNSQRVEPTINSINTDQTTVDKSPYPPLENSIGNTSSTINTNQTKELKQHKLELFESIRLVLFSHKKTRSTVSVISVLLVLALVILITFNSPMPDKKPIEQKSKNQEIVTDFQHKLTLPDNFSIMIAINNALVIHWQADVEDNSKVWALDSAEGDKNCENIAFNKGETIRTYSVNAMDSSYYAYFSPLDTKALIKNIAFKNNFSLCGYSFSLKGSQATLDKSPFYANLIEY